MEKMIKPRLLCILHRSPPVHGAAKMGDLIASNEKLQENFDCHFITIKSSETISDIGKINLKKIYLVLELYVKVLFALLTIRPDKIYFTSSISGVAFYRDLLISTLWKIYKRFKSIDVYYHYHTKGVDEFVSSSERNLNLTRFFLKEVNLMLLTPMLEKDFAKVQTYNKVFHLPNGVEDRLKGTDTEQYFATKYECNRPLETLYLSNMIKSKGYLSVLELANQTKESSINYHFAGEWQNSEDEEEFFDYIEQNELEEKVVFHGFVDSDAKHRLYEKVDILFFPTRYPKESFGLVLIEALSYGVTCIATDEGSNLYILDEKSSVIIEEVEQLFEALEVAKDKLINIETARYCRERFLQNFTLHQFENNLVETFQKELSA